MSQNSLGNETVNIAVVILAKNEESSIERCLASVACCRQVFVVDDHSSDRTAELSRSSGAAVVQHEFTGFAAQRNWALSTLNFETPWVLHLDADEVATAEMLGEIARSIEQGGADIAAYRTCRKTMLFGKWLKWSDGFPVWIMRLVHVEHARFQDSGHGEVPVPEVEGEMGTIRAPFVHHPFSRGLADWFLRHNKYSSREAELEFRESPSIRWFDILSRDRASRRRAVRSFSRRLPCRSQLRFLYQYVFKLGFLDGRAGFEFCQLMAIYEKQIVMKRRELERAQKGTSP